MRIRHGGSGIPILLCGCACVCDEFFEYVCFCAYANTRVPFALFLYASTLYETSATCICVPLSTCAKCPHLFVLVYTEFSCVRLLSVVCLRV